MQAVSKEYKELLKAPFIDSTYKTTVDIGAINQQAQSQAYITLDTNMTHYASTNVFDDVVSDPYASYELNRTKADGSLKFMGKPLPAGIVSSQVSDKDGYIDHVVRIKSYSSIVLSVKGITITFAPDVYAVDFDILNPQGDIVLSANGNTDTTYINDFVYEFGQYIDIHVKRINKPFYRSRISCIKFGLALKFSDEIMSTTFKEQLQLISSELYVSDLSLTVSNVDNVYDTENRTSEINFLEEYQKVQVTLTLPLPSGRSEQILLCTMFLNSWSSKKGETATFKATDRFNYLVGEFNKGLYRPTGITLYDLAVEVLQDADIPDDEYLLDSYLKTIKVYNPLPVMTHKECLQLIANAGRCILKQDRQGRIVIKSSFVPGMTVQSEDKVPYADMDMSLTPKATYATYEQDFTLADGKTFFMPRDGGYLKTGYVSNTLSNDDCLYGDKPHILIDFEVSTSLFGFNLTFGQAVTSDFIVTTYLNGSTVETLAFADNTTKDFCLDYPFKECDRILVTFIRSSKPQQRVYVHSVTFDTTTDKYVTGNDISQGSLEGIKTDTIKRVDMICTIYTPSSVEESQDIKITKVAGDDKTTMIMFNDPMSKARLQMAGKDVGYDFKTARMMVDLEPPHEGVKEYTLQLVGAKLNKVTRTLPFAINPSGLIKTHENPLISDTQLAKDTGQWIAAYLKADREYNFGLVLGDASLDSNDIIHQANDYDDNLRTQIYSHEVSIAGAISSKVKTRKVV